MRWSSMGPHHHHGLLKGSSRGQDQGALGRRARLMTVHLPELSQPLARLVQPGQRLSPDALGVLAKLGVDRGHPGRQLASEPDPPQPVPGRAPDLGCLAAVGGADAPAANRPSFTGLAVRAVSPARDVPGLTRHGYSLMGGGLPVKPGARDPGPPGVQPDSSGLRAALWSASLNMACQSCSYSRACTPCWFCWECWAGDHPARREAARGAHGQEPGR